MGPIPPINLGSTSNMAPIRSASTPAGAGVGAPAGTPTAGVVGGGSAITSLVSQVSQLLSSLGGGLQNDKMMRLLIALIILMAILNDQSGQEDQQAPSLSLLGQNGGGQPFLIHQSYSMISISIEQTSVTTTVYGDAAAFDSMGSQGSNSGGLIDLSA